MRVFNICMSTYAAISHAWYMFRCVLWLEFADLLYIVQGFTPKAGTFLPFGAGSRLCPGNDLAKLEISIFLHYFLLNHRWLYLATFSSSFLTRRFLCKKHFQLLFFYSIETERFIYIFTSLRVKKNDVWWLRTLRMIVENLESLQSIQYQYNLK
jgi:hypothetical protein